MAIEEGEPNGMQPDARDEANTFQVFIHQTCALVIPTISFATSFASSSLRRSPSSMSTSARAEF